MALTSRSTESRRPVVQLVVGAAVLWAGVGLLLAALALAGAPIASSYGRPLRGWPAVGACLIFALTLGGFSAASGALALWLGGRLTRRGPPPPPADAGAPAASRSAAADRA